MTVPSGSDDEVKISISSEPPRLSREDRCGTTIPVPAATGDASADAPTCGAQLPQRCPMALQSGALRDPPLPFGQPTSEK